MISMISTYIYIIRIYICSDTSEKCLTNVCLYAIATQTLFLILVILYPPEW